MFVRLRLLVLVCGWTVNGLASSLYILGTDGRRFSVVKFFCLGGSVLIWSRTVLPTFCLGVAAEFSVLVKQTCVLPCNLLFFVAYADFGFVAVGR